MMSKELDLFLFITVIHAALSDSRLKDFIYPNV